VVDMDLLFFELSLSTVVFCALDHRFRVSGESNLTWGRTIIPLRVCSPSLYLGDPCVVDENICGPC